MKTTVFTKMSATSLRELRSVWVNPPKRKELLGELPGGEGSIRLVREIEEEQECDGG